MKKLLLALVVMCSLQSEAQYETDAKVIIEPCIGVPNAGRMYLGMVNIFDEYDGFVVTGSPVQFGGRIEYLATESMGVAIEVNYEKSGYELAREIYDDNINEYVDSTQTWEITKLRVFARWVYHFGYSDKVDWYTGAGLGYSHETISSLDGRPEIVDYAFAFVPKFFDRASTPLAARINLGARFMFSKNVGMVTEIGLGSGSLLQIGLSTRF